VNQPESEKARRQKNQEVNQPKGETAKERKSQIPRSLQQVVWAAGNRNFCSHVLSLPEAKVPYMELLLPGIFIPWNSHSQELSFPGTFAPHSELTL